MVEETGHILVVDDNRMNRLTLMHGAQQLGHTLMSPRAATRRWRFDPFFTVKPPGAGVGLGLTISHNITVQKHHGQISLASEPGNTCFQVRLPLDGQLQDDSR